MPGHIKLVKGAVDPDPTEFLWPSMEMKKEDQAKASDCLVRFPNCLSGLGNLTMDRWAWFAGMEFSSQITRGKLR